MFLVLNQSSVDGTRWSVSNLLLSDSVGSVLPDVHRCTGSKGWDICNLETPCKLSYVEVVPYSFQPAMYEKACFPTRLRFLKRRQGGNVRAPKKQGMEKAKSRVEAQST